jgi:hypothetical protein
MIPQLRRPLAASLSFVVVGCATDTTTFLNYGTARSSAAPPSRVELLNAPDVSDGLAINYANSVEIIMRCKATQNRIAREVSSTAQIALAAFAGAGAALGYGVTTLTVLGLSSAGVPQLQSLFDAKGRSEAYNQAAEMIHDGVIEYYDHNSVPRNDQLTPNGVTLVKKVSAAVNLVNDTMEGRLPSRAVMSNALEAMTPEGTKPQVPGQPPVNEMPKRTIVHVVEKPPPVRIQPPQAESLIAAIVRFLRAHVKDSEGIAELNKACDLVNQNSATLLLTKTNSTDPEQAREEIEGQIEAIDDLTQLNMIQATFTRTIK